MRIPVLFLATYLAAVLQISLADVVSVGHVGPDLLAMVAMVWTLQRPSPCGFLIAGLIGLLGDLIASGHPGLGMAVYLLAGYGAARWARWTPNHVAWRVCAVWLATSAIAVALGAGRRLLGETEIPVATLLVRGLAVGVYTAGLAVPVLLVLKWLGESFVSDDSTGRLARL